MERSDGAGRNGDQGQPDAAVYSLRHWRERLLDLSRRNPLLYFSHSRGTKVRIAHPAPADLYEALVLREKRLTFPKPVGWSVEDAQFSQELAEAGDGTVRESAGDIVVDYTTGSAKDVVVLQQKLRRLETNARASLDEQGINTLYVALGFLRWREPGSAETDDVAPLILVPAAMQHRRGHAYELSCYEVDARPNPVLAYQLKQAFERALPPFDSYSGLDGGTPDLPAYFAAVGSIVESLGWRVLEDAWIAHFSFEKLVMYEDLGQPGTEEAIAEHPVVGALVQAHEYESRPIPPELTPPTAFDRPDLFPVKDADFFQLEVLANAAAGNSLAVQGPPGTGKSQTIANLIAQALRFGKSVLFVSEKRAALDVVHRRLQECGLDRLCLELHSHRTQRRSLAHELHSALELALEDAPISDVEGFERRSALRDRLDEYVRQLHQPRGEAGLTAFQVHGELARLSRVPDVDAPLPLPALAVDQRREQQMRDALREIQETRVWDRAAGHPWREAAPPEPLVLVRAELEACLRGLIDGLEELSGLQGRAKASLGESLVPESMRDLEGVLTVLSVLAEPPESVKSALLARSEVDRRERSRVVRVICSKLLELVIGTDLVPAYQGRYARWWRRMGPGYWRARRRLGRTLGRRIGWREGLEALTAAHAYRDVLRQIAEAIDVDIERSEVPSGSLSSSTGDIIISVVAWVGRRVLDDTVIKLPADAVLRLLRSPEEVVTAAHSLREDLTAARDRIQSSLRALIDLFPDGLDGSPLAAMSLAELRGRAVEWQDHLDLLDEWRGFRNAMERAERCGLRAFLEAARAAGLPNQELERAFLRLLRLRWLQEVYPDAPALRDFDPGNHERAIRELSELDRDLLRSAPQLVLRAAYDRQRPVRTADDYLSVRGRPGAGRPDQDERIQDLKRQIKLLRREFNKKTRHLPIRRMLPEIADLLSLLKPCLLMSPLSVATYLPRDRFRFDLVIFDEASQVLPEDAVGAMLRAEQAVIFGDSKQLPPTPFFRRVLDEDGEEDTEEGATEGDVRGFESILDLTKGVLPVATLRWHYRSRDERLIAFSNERFYGESPLITFPSPDRTTDSTGVRLVVAEDGCWERGVKRNLPEARRVVELILEHLRLRPRRSLGVIALGLGQAEVIELELNRRLLDHPDLGARLEANPEEPFFVKNLENVQGDERDEIILSIGYGPQEPRGAVPLRFGPINEQGGERRLNVAITRARYRTTVVSSFQPEALLRATETLNLGPRYLHEYLVYAKREGRRPQIPDSDPDRQPESEFEEAVREALEARGYQVDSQVGQSGYRIDLAVRDPDRPTRYILAIECDGASYHSCPAVRDRDRLRQEQLKALEWRFHRIWSTDWIRAPDHALDRVVKAIEQARKAD